MSIRFAAMSRRLVAAGGLVAVLVYVAWIGGLFPHIFNNINALI
jgi:hypothetical protein